ncbi:hypothetical protein K8T06_00460 [bacterium]|nr:hypothetical protein [bacterium]
MKQAIEDFPFAIASGITTENVSDYLPFADCFLVVTGINRDFHNLDPDQVRELVDKVRSYKAESVETNSFTSNEHTEKPSRTVCFICQ